MINLQSIRKHSSLTPNKAALVDGECCLTWQQLQNETEKKILFLLTRFETGLPKQACYISHNRIEIVSWLSAFATLNIPVTGLDYSLPLPVLKNLSKLIGADLILMSIASPIGNDGTFELGWPWAVQFDMDSPTIVYADAVGKKFGVDILEYISKFLITPPYRAIGLTSGTSGSPKAVIRTRSFDKRRFAYFANRYHFTQEDIFLLSMPLYHAAGNGWARMFMSLGATVHFANINVPREISSIISKEMITASVMTPALLSDVLDAFDAGVSYKDGHLKWLLIGGKHFPVSQKQRALGKLGPVIYEYYGTTETGVNTIAEPDDLAHCPNSVGRVFDGNSVVIVDANGVCVDPGQIGTVAISSYMNMDSYIDGSVNTLLVNGENFLLTPEKGYMDKEGRLFLLNRSSHQNNHHHLYRLEDAIRSIPYVKDVALILNGDTENAKVECAIEMHAHPYQLSCLLEEVQSLAGRENLQLARHLIVPRIPYSPSGKVRLNELKSLLDKLQAEATQAEGNILL